MYGSLGATRELSGRSLGALWELVAVAGIFIKLTIHSNNEFIRLQSLRTLRIEYSQFIRPKDSDATNW